MLLGLSAGSQNIVVVVFGPAAALQREAMAKALWLILKPKTTDCFASD